MKSGSYLYIVDYLLNTEYNEVIPVNGECSIIDYLFAHNIPLLEACYISEE